MDLYDPTVVKAPPLKLGIIDLVAGEHVLKFQSKGKNVESKGYYFGLDYIELIPLEQ